MGTWTKAEALPETMPRRAALLPPFVQVGESHSVRGVSYDDKKGDRTAAILGARLVQLAPESLGLSVVESPEDPELMQVPRRYRERALELRGRASGGAELNKSYHELIHRTVSQEVKTWAGTGFELIKNPGVLEEVAQLIGDDVPTLSRLADLGIPAALIVVADELRSRPEFFKDWPLSFTIVHVVLLDTRSGRAYWVADYSHQDGIDDFCVGHRWIGSDKDAAVIMEWILDAVSKEIRPAGMAVPPESSTVGPGDPKRVSR